MAGLVAVDATWTQSISTPVDHKGIREHFLVPFSQCQDLADLRPLVRSVCVCVVAALVGLFWRFSLLQLFYKTPVQWERFPLRESL